MDKVIKFTQGKKTYALALLAIVYVVAGVILGQDVDIEVLQIALTGAALKSAINNK